MDEIEIKGEIGADPESCIFTVDRPVYAGGAAYFANRELAATSPLATKLFDIPEIQTVLIVENQVTVTKSGYEPWQQFGKQIGSKIREHLRSGASAVTEEYRKSLPSEEEIRTRVEQVLQAEINPAVAGHGGYIDLIDVKQNSIFLRLGGGCHGCGAASMTLKQGVEKAIRRAVPEVGEVLDVTDHASGRNPYYMPMH